MDSIEITEEEIADLKEKIADLKKEKTESSDAIARLQKKDLVFSLLQNNSCRPERLEAASKLVPDTLRVSGNTLKAVSENLIPEDFISDLKSTVPEFFVGAEESSIAQKLIRKR